MKHFAHFLTILIISCLFASVYATNSFDIILKPKWKELGCHGSKCADFGGKWILIGSITFKKRFKDPITIDAINLRWCGEKIDNVTASLYHKIVGKEFLAIEGNLVCDGGWNSKTQTLIFNFDEAEKLAPTTIFYIVLTIPEDIEPTLKKGHFYLENGCLPHPFKQCSQNEKLILAINDTPIKNAMR